MAERVSKLYHQTAKAISSALVELLEQKHLYQSVEIDDVPLRKIVAPPASPIPKYPPISGEDRDVAILLSQYLRGPWNLSLAREIPPLYLRQIGPKPLNLFLLPTVKISCAKCDAINPPHNPGYVGLTVDSTCVFATTEGTIQIFAIPYQCQSCKCEPLFFLVRREVFKLTLVGRSQFQEIAVPDFIPKNQRKFYRNAAIADQTGFTLAAALYLRTLIEQYFYQIIPESDIKALRGNPTGDKLAELYAKTLPRNFPDSFPSLKKAYDDLSKIVHSGKENDETKKSIIVIRTAVDGHFKAVQLFKDMPAQ